MIGDEVSFKTGVKWWRRWRVWKIGSLIEGVFGRSTSTEIKAFYRLIWLDGTTFVLPCFLTLIQTICRKSLAITLPKNGKSPLPVDLRRSKTSLLELLMKGLSDGFLLPSQLRTHGRGPRGRPHYFQTKLKKIFGDRPPPPLISESEWPDPPPLISRSEFGTMSCGRTEGRFGFTSGFMWMGPQWSNLHLNWFIRESRTSSAIAPWIVSRDHMNKRPYPDPVKVSPVLWRRPITHGWW